MNRRPQVRVAMVGLGWAAREIWLDRLLAHPGYTVVSVVDPDPKARAAWAATGTGAGSLESVEELEPGQVDLAVVAVPNHLHGSIATRLLERGVTVFVEKPVCLTSAESARLAAAERSGPAVLLAGSAAVHRADVRALHAAAEGLGDIRHIEASWVRARGVPAGGGWFTRRELAGGGALLDLGWHLFDVLGPLIGPARFDQVAGAVSADFIAGGTAAARWRGDAPAGGAVTADVEDTARGFLVTEDGVSVSLRTSWASHEPLDVTTVRVDGTAGTASLRCTFGFSPQRAGGSELLVGRHGRTDAVPLADQPIGVEYDRQLDDLLTRLADPGAKGRAAEEADRTIRVIERLYASARASRGRTSRPSNPSGATPQPTTTM
ncbi:Gfo/Idh/MocA family protein [Streptomyces sp. MAR4 CNX-425]|uniref:Gfo/Idh/MocA family protein n=1 Tax=Streptomyces sp. MAR4 CNX-425 TaxID=3406343 RepID=UPI003B50E682